MNREHFKFTYENADNFQAFPTNCLTLCHGGPFADGDFSIEGIPPFNPMTLLHGEESITMYKPLKTNGKYMIKEKVADLQDKGKSFILVFDSEIREADTKDLTAVVRSSLFVRSKGGFGHKGTIKNKYPDIPKRNPDFVGEETTSKN